MSEFARYFRLKDERRTSFRLNTRVDAALFVDLDGLLPKTRKMLDGEERAPLAVFEGDFGSGKTHLLRHVERVMAPGLGFQPLYLKLSGFERRSDFYTLHRMLFPVILEAVKPVLWDAHRERDALFGDDRLATEVVHALRDLATRPIDKPAASAVQSESWLLGNLTPSQAAKAGYPALLFQRAGPVQLVEIYKVLADFHRRATGRRLLLLLDEGESFTQVVDEDAQARIGQGFRELFDSENESIGLFLGLTTPRSRGGTHPMLRTDVRTRIGGDRYHKLTPLHTTDRRRQFMSRLWEQIADAGTLPFMLADDARDYVVEHLDDLRWLSSETKMAASPTPRDLLNVLSKIGRFALDQQLGLPIRAATLKAWFVE